jgi:hypothetical protein
MTIPEKQREKRKEKRQQSPLCDCPSLFFTNNNGLKNGILWILRLRAE